MIDGEETTVGAVDPFFMSDLPPPNAPFSLPRSPLDFFSVGSGEGAEACSCERGCGLTTPTAAVGAEVWTDGEELLVAWLAIGPGCKGEDARIVDDETGDARSTVCACISGGGIFSLSRAEWLTESTRLSEGVKPP